MDPLWIMCSLFLLNLAKRAKLLCLRQSFEYARRCGLPREVFPWELYLVARGHHGAPPRPTGGTPP